MLLFKIQERKKKRTDDNTNNNNTFVDILGIGGAGGGAYVS